MSLAVAGQGQHHGPSASNPKSGRPVQPLQLLTGACGQSWAHSTGPEQGILKPNTRPRVISKENLNHQAASASDLLLTLREIYYTLL